MIKLISVFRPKFGDAWGYSHKREDTSGMWLYNRAKFYDNPLHHRRDLSLDKDTANLIYSKIADNKHKLFQFLRKIICI